MSQRPLLLCTDMDRTVIPNGDAPEHPHARAVFRAFCARDNVTLAYVTGRDLALAQNAVRQYHLPQPDYYITDVGSGLYHVQDGQWQIFQPWCQEITPCWKGRCAADLMEFVCDLPELTLQEPEKQNTFKLSFYLPFDLNPDALLETLHQRFSEQGIDVSLIWSLDEPNRVGLLDILPANATKQHAIRFLAGQFDHTELLFAGDSGNDLPVLESDIPSILVANAADELKNLAQHLAQKNQLAHTLYIAHNRHSNDGNYCAGVLQGIAHYRPDDLPLTLLPDEPS